MIHMESKNSAGPLIGTIVIIILIVVAALYFWSARLTVSENSASQTAGVAAASTSDDIGSMQSDLQVQDPGPDTSALGN